MEKLESEITSKHGHITELVSDVDLRALAAHYLCEQRIALGVMNGDYTLDESLFSSEEEFFEYFDACDVYAVTKRNAYEAALIPETNPLSTLDKDWAELRGVTSTNNLFAWFEGFELSHAELYNARAIGSEEGTLLFLLRSRYPSFFEDCVTAAALRARYDDMDMNDYSEGSVDRVIVRWNCDQYMSDALERLADLASETGLDVMDLCR